MIKIGIDFTATTILLLMLLLLILSMHLLPD